MDEYSGMIFANRYRVINLLGVGPCKRTYLATDVALSRQVTLVLTNLEVPRTDLSEVMDEIGILSQVGVHDNIVVLYDYGIADGVAFLVFQYMPGGTLEEYIRQNESSGRQLTVDEVRRLGRQLVRALAQVHQYGVIHNSIAPGNVWLDERRVVHLGGFDLAVRRDGQPPASHTLPGTNKQYASPEQIAGLHTDERSDLYSFGAVLYFALTGEPPLRSTKRLVEPLALREDTPPELNSLICRLLADSPNDRPGAAVEALELLKPPVAIPNRHMAVIREPDAAVMSGIDKKTFRSWLEALPFPIASILWLYHAELEPKSKVDNLVRFFEALAQFLVVVQLSAYIRDRAFFNSRSTTSLQTKSGNSFRVDLRVPTFGTWVELYENFSGMIQDTLRDENGSANKCYELFAARSRDQIELLANPDLCQILYQARDHRNAWIGHGGAASQQEHRRRLTALENLLRKTESILGTTFESWNLLQPGYAAFTNGLYSLRAAILMGTNSDFRQAEVPVRDPLDTNRLYLLNAPRSLELVPLIRVLVDQQTGRNACYFFNRIQAGEVRWVSHHYKAESELSLYDSNVMELLSELRRNSE
jgi:serine/threonine protein kinase